MTAPQPGAVTITRRIAPGKILITEARFITPEQLRAEQPVQTAAKPAPAPIADLMRRYEAGETPDQIGASLGVSGAAVRKRLIKAGAAMRGHVASHAKYRIPVAERKPRASRARTTERVATPKEIAEREREVPEWMRPAASPSASPAWAAADDALLMEMRQADEAWGPIARLLGKTTDECRDRWYEAGRKEGMA